MRSQALACLLLLGAVAAWSIERRTSLIDEAASCPPNMPSNYWDADPTDAVAQLQQKLEDGDAELPFHEELGYLPAVLKALDVEESSRVLVFSKTSFQSSRIFRGSRERYLARRDR